MGSKQTGNVDRNDNYFKYYLSIGRIDYKKSIYDGLMMTSGILTVTFIMHKLGEGKYTPSLSMKDYFSLGFVTVLSQMAIDYGKAKGKIPSGLT